MNKCFVCGSSLKKQKIDIARYWGDQLIALSDVPALICKKCGERYFEARVSEKIDRRIQAALKKKISAPRINIPLVQF